MDSIFQIFIQDDEMNKVPIKVTKNTSIREVQTIYNNQIENKINFETFALFYKGNQLQNSQTIGEIGIKRKQILSLLDLRDKIDAANKYFY